MEVDYPARLQTATPKKPYMAPALKTYGDIRDLTLGGSPGTGESGIGNPHFPKAQPPGVMDVPGQDFLNR